jgi:2-polyprenyl-6-methoxyphenol hydroxylase-like FAD-dependent oxidoreductase
MPTTHLTTPEHDVVVVGARCAGATTAMLLARAGHDVVLLDRTAFPADTFSTHAIARSGVVQLTRWGLLDAVVDSGAPPIRDIAFHDGSGVVTRRLKDRHGVDALVAPRRTVLDHLLVDAAATAGAQVRTGVTVTGVTRAEDGRVTGVRGRTVDGPVEVRARLVVGADGLRSRVARSVGSPVVLAGPSGGSIHYAYFAGHWPAMEYHSGDRSFAGIFPTHGGEACVWVCVPGAVAVDARRRHASVDDTFRSLLGAAPTLVDRLAGARQTTAARGAIGLPNQARTATGPGWALVGDAVHHRDPITGHGISDAFRDAELLAAAVDGVLAGADEAGALGGYASRRAAMARPVFDLTCAMATFPDPHRFRELQMRLSDAIEAEAAVLAEGAAVMGTAGV